MTYSELRQYHREHERIMAAARRLSSSQMARVANHTTKGTDWTGCNKGYIADCFIVENERRHYMDKFIRNLENGC